MNNHSKPAEPTSSGISRGIRGSALYAAVVLGLVLIPYPFQAGRPWASPVFSEPGNLNRDAPEWISIAETTPFLSGAARMRAGRPLYPLPAYILRHTVPETISTVAIYRALNLAWFLLAAWLLRWWTLVWTRDEWAALAAGALFAASPFVQVFLSQPLPELLGAVAILGGICAAARAAGWTPKPRPIPETPRQRVRRRRAWKPWTAAGAVTAFLLLGKEWYGLYACLLLIALWKRAWRPLLGYAAGAAAVHLAYLAWFTWGLEKTYAPYGAESHGFLSWVVEDLTHRPVLGQAWYFIYLAGRIVVRTAQAYLGWPLVLAAIGGVAFAVRPRIVHVLAYLIGFYALFVAINIVTPRIVYPVFVPLVLPAAGAGAVSIGRALAAGHGTKAAAAWIVLLSILLALGIVLDPYRFFYYG